MPSLHITDPRGTLETPARSHFSVTGNEVTGFIFLAQSRAATAASGLEPTRDCSPQASRRLLAPSRLPPSWPWLSFVGVPTRSASPSVCEPGTPDLPGPTQKEVCVVRLHEFAPVRCWWLLWGTRDHCLHSCLVHLFCVRWAGCSGVLRNFRRSPNHSVYSMMLVPGNLSTLEWFQTCTNDHTHTQTPVPSHTAHVCTHTCTHTQGSETAHTIHRAHIDKYARLHTHTELTQDTHTHWFTHSAHTVRTPIHMCIYSQQTHMHTHKCALTHSSHVHTHVHSYTQLKYCTHNSQCAYRQTCTHTQSSHGTHMHTGVHTQLTQCTYTCTRIYTAHTCHHYRVPSHTHLTHMYTCALKHVIQTLHT